MVLLEREPIFDSLDQLLADASQGLGHVVLLSGEAGIGKTAVVDALMETKRESARILWGGCDDLLSARPLGPVWDMATEEPELERILRDGDRHEVFAELLDMLGRSLRPTLMIIEDVHWADDSTLDLIKYLGRRISDTHALLILTYRDDEIYGDHPLRPALGDLPAGVVVRISLQPLSTSAVLELAGDAASAESIWEVSKGNSFFVTEMIASGNDVVPTSIRDAIRTRLLRLGAAARSLAELVSVVPGRVELSLLAKAASDTESAIQECEDAGILEVRGDFVAFRHELARRAVEGDLSEMRRRSLNDSILTAGTELGVDIARTAHHARQAGDVEAIVQLVPMAARRASAMESHREALQQLRAMEPYLDQISPEELADHYDLWAWEEHLAATKLDRTIIEKAVDLRRKLGDPAALGDTLLAASRVAWVGNRRASAVELAKEASEVLTPVGGESLALAYSTLSQLAMLGGDEEETSVFAAKAFEISGPEASPARAHALNNLGAVKSNLRYPEGVDELEQSYRMSESIGTSHEQTRAAVNIAWSALEWRDLPTAEIWIDRGLQVAVDRELPTFESYLLAEQAILHEMRGEWLAAEGKALEVLEAGWRFTGPCTVAARVLARVQTRQGLPDARQTIAKAWEMATTADELQRLGPAAAVLTEFLWLNDGAGQLPIEGARQTMEMCVQTGHHWYSGDIGIWLFLNGIIDALPEGSPEPYAAMEAGDWVSAAEFWEQADAPYEQAVALSLGSNEAKVSALEILDRLGAVPLAPRIRTELQKAGVTGIPRGPQRATKQNPLGLTPRQSDVLELLADRVTNAEIADSLFVSPRTVDHHVSAILSKLGVQSRDDAVKIAREAGLVS